MNKAAISSNISKQMFYCRNNFSTFRVTSIQSLSVCQVCFYNLLYKTIVQLTLRHNLNCTFLDSKSSVFLIQQPAPLMRTARKATSSACLRTHWHSARCRKTIFWPESGLCQTSHAVRHRTLFTSLLEQMGIVLPSTVMEYCLLDLLLGRTYNQVVDHYLCGFFYFLMF